MPLRGGRRTLGPGCELISELDVAGCATALGAAVLRVRRPRTEHMPATVQPGWSWRGAADRRPTAALACYNENEDLLFVGFRPDRAGTAVTVVPMVRGDETATLRAWAGADPSLREVGPVPGGLVALGPPPVPAGIVEDILDTAGLPDTADRRDQVAALLTRRINLEAGQLVGSADPARGRRFVAGHRWRAGAELTVARRILADLAGRDPWVLPYVQDLPMRVRAMLLQPGTVRAGLPR